MKDVKGTNNPDSDKRINILWPPPPLPPIPFDYELHLQVRQQLPHEHRFEGRNPPLLTLLAPEPGSGEKGKTVKGNR